MHPTVPPGVAAWPDRATLLAARQDQLAALEGELLSGRRTAPVLGWLLLPVIAVPLVQALSEESTLPPPAALVVVVGLLAVAGWRLLRHHRRTRLLRALLGEWRELDRDPRWRGLPPGEIDPAATTVHDSRDDPRLAQVAGHARVDASVRTRGAGMVWLTVLTPLAAVEGVLVLGMFVASFAQASGGATAAGAVASLVAVPTVVAMVGWFGRTALDRQGELNRAALEQQVYAVRSRLLHGDGPVGVPRRTPPLAARVVGPLAVLALLGLLVWQAFRVSTTGGLVVTGLLGLLVLVLLVPVWRQRPVHVVPLLSTGPGLLQRPAKRVAARRDHGDVVLTGAGETLRIPAAEIVGIEPVTLAFALAPEAVVVVTTGEPVVVAGRGTGCLLTTPTAE